MKHTPIEFPPNPPFESHVFVRVGDINYGGHLGNDAVLALAHEARIRWLRAHGLSEVDVGGCGLIMTDAHIEYRNQARLGDELRLEIAPGDKRASRFRLLCRISRPADEAEIALVEVGLACFDYERERPARMPAPLADALAAD